MDKRNTSRKLQMYAFDSGRGVSMPGQSGMLLKAWWQLNMTTRPLLILYSMINLPSVLLCSSDRQPRVDSMAETLS